MDQLADPPAPSPLLRLLRPFGRRIWRKLAPPAFELVTHEKYTATFPDAPNDPLRAERIAAFLDSEGLILRRSIQHPWPAQIKLLERVHTPEYLDTAQDPRTLTAIFGAEVSAQQVDRLLDFQRLQTGGTLLATSRARRAGVCVNLGGGFHHAMADRGGGFCIFNDVAVAVAAERDRGFRGRVLIVDLDLHDGDGTRHIFADDPEVYTFSIHARHWGPTEAAGSTSVELGSAVEDQTYLEAIEHHLPPVFESFDPQLVFYLAGCDPAREDPMGDWKITPQAMLKRDLRVFDLARSRRQVPLVILLAGGYSLEAWRYSARFLASLASRRRPLEPPSTEDMTFRRYRYLARQFDSGQLSDADSGNDFGLTDDDLILPGWGMRPETRLLGFYTRHGVELVLERTGFFNRLRDLGFDHPTLVFDLADPSDHSVRVFGDPENKDLLVDLRVHRDRRTIPGYELLAVDWLMMQNPRARFRPGRPHLPGQEHPGLGMLDDVVALLAVACERQHLDGLVFTPSHFHVAAYVKSHLAFLEPETRSRFEALMELFRDTPLPEAAAAIAAGRVIDVDSDEVFRWRPEPMLLPVSERLERQMKTADQKKTHPYRLRVIA